MKRIIFRIGILLIFVIIILKCDIPMTKNSVMGTYVNTNYKNKHCCLESPHNADTLTLKSDGKFSSGYYGIGSYDINYGLFETEIELHYISEMGKAGFYSSFRNKIFEGPRIGMNDDLNHYYQKIEQ